MNAQLGQVTTDIFGRSVLQTEFNRAGGMFPSMKTGSMHISGADIGRGLGWVILLCGIGATVLIALPEALPDRSIRRGLTLAAAALGAELLIYLLGSNFRHASYGLLLVVVAYGCIAQGAFVRVGNDQSS